MCPYYDCGLPIRNADICIAPGSHVAALLAGVDLVVAVDEALAVTVCLSVCNCARYRVFHSLAKLK